MLVLRRNEGQWLEIRHRSGDLIRIRVCNIRPWRSLGQLDLAFDDSAHNFHIHRPERPLYKREFTQGAEEVAGTAPPPATSVELVSHDPADVLTIDLTCSVPPVAGAC
jgi:hypothetical protein